MPIELFRTITNLKLKANMRENVGIMFPDKQQQMSRH